jgi:hypothetical protein
MTNISIYTNVKQTKTDKTIPFDLFLDGIREGSWQDVVLPIRVIQDEKQRAAAKQKAPCVTVGGTFKERSDSGLIQHSGYIAIDIDDVEDINHLKSIICADRYVYAAFVSISGRGLCLIFKINPAKHRESFQGISEYLYENYQVIADPTSINVSRLRFVSYDPFIYIADHVDKFIKYPKSKPPKKIEKVIYAKDDFEQILEQIQSRRLNLCENYHEWLRIAFSLVHQFGEAGRGYFHQISQYSSKYDSVITDKQYTSCLKHKGSNQATIATFYYYCKSAGIQLYSERTRKIAYSASSGKKSGLNASQVAENIKKFEGIEGADVQQLAQQVMDNSVELNEDTLLDQVEMWLRQNYDLRRNEITRYIENRGIPMEKREYNSVFIKGKKIFDKLNFELMDRLINSDFVADFNPFKYFFEANKEKGQLSAAIATQPAELFESDDPEFKAATGSTNLFAPNIFNLFDSIKSNDDEYLQHFGKKWMVGIIASIHGEHSPLMLVLSGQRHGSGKTEFFRRLLPKELHSYYAESKLDAGKDDEILMCQKLIIMDDEMGGKSKKESKRLKELTSKQTFSLREPYGRNNVDLNRLAVLCGTTNDNEILNDPTGNRRIIPVQVIEMDHAKYNGVNKTDLFMEAYNLWKSGFDWHLSRHDIDYLAKYNTDFEVVSLEAELLQKYFEPGQFIEMTSSEIKVEIEDFTKQKLSLDKLGKELKRLGFVQKFRRVGLSTKRMWLVEKINNENKRFEGPKPGAFPGIAQRDRADFF